MRPLEIAAFALGALPFVVAVVLLVLGFGGLMNPPK